MTEQKETTFDIAAQIRELMQMGEEHGPEFIADTIESMEGTIHEKLKGFRSVMDQLDIDAKSAKAQAAIYKEKVDEFKAIENKLTNERKNMTYPILILLKSMGKTSISGDYGTFYIRKNPDSFKLDLSKIPTQFQERKISFEPNKDAIKEALKNGKSFDFAWFEKGKEQVLLK